jgi:hypothetical protein
MSNVGAHLDVIPRGRDGRVHPEPARLELDDGHEDVGGDAAESQRLLLLEQPSAALHCRRTRVPGRSRRRGGARWLDPWRTPRRPDPWPKGRVRRRLVQRMGRRRCSEREVGSEEQRNRANRIEGKNGQG